MNLQNGYKVIYEKAADGKRTFYASKTGVFADAEVIAEAEIGKYKLIYEKAGRFYGSETGVPADTDYCFEAFNKVFVEGYKEPVAPAAETPVEEPAKEPEQEPAKEEDLGDDESVTPEE